MASPKSLPAAADAFWRDLAEHVQRMFKDHPDAAQQAERFLQNFKDSHVKTVAKVNLEQAEQLCGQAMQWLEEQQKGQGL
ncbi:unnamed protein product [Vitrella brassicaformis CCMP3155]|uniref:Uncharacterized protein n=1 Tax=Vitrella brassicaformis (strain CCMP3155) TaxID=1169540 RepID=A0A0G4EXC6_VITBC|nr:unnamed protein product [Vitrella brassicaformis CCMP3155]|eukprot:CEM02745.1 unnamed protein product [Vitrella brassicaformis CCMP3155]